VAKSRRILNDAELIEYSGYHLLYEVQMLFGTAALLSRASYPSDPEVAHVLHCALLEGFGIHLRNLIEFFYPGKKPHPADVRADDFFAGQKRTRGFPAISAPLIRARERASKELAHLTTERITGTPPEKEWRYMELTAEMCKILHEFVGAASPEKLHSNVGQQVRQFMAASRL
jgi:hypothetical protein